MNTSRRVIAIVLFVCLTVTSGAYASTIRGDVTNDGNVTFEDYVLFMAWLQAGKPFNATQVQTVAQGLVPTLAATMVDFPSNDRNDFNGDGSLDTKDCAILAAWIQTVRSNDATLIMNVAREYNATIAGSIVLMPGSPMSGGSTGTAVGTGTGTSFNGTVGTWSANLPLVSCTGMLVLSNYGSISPSSLAAQVSFSDGITRTWQYLAVSGSELRLSFNGTDFFDRSVNLVRFNTALPNGTTVWFKQDGAQTGAKLVVSNGVLIPESTSGTGTGTGTSTNTGGSTGTGTGTGSGGTSQLVMFGSSVNCPSNAVYVVLGRDVSTLATSTMIYAPTTVGTATFMMNYPASSASGTVFDLIGGVPAATPFQFSTLFFYPGIPTGTIVSVLHQGSSVGNATAQ